MVENQNIFVVFADIGHMVTKFGHLAPITSVDFFQPLEALVLIASKVLRRPHRFCHEALLVRQQFVFQRLSWHI